MDARQWFACVLWSLATFGPAVTQGLAVDCVMDVSPRISCRCLDRDSIGKEDLSEIIDRFVAAYFVNVRIQHIVITECGNLDLFVNLRAFIVDGVPQNISIITFELVDRLQLDIQNVDYGDKQFVFSAVQYLTLTGSMMHPFTRVSIFVLNDRFYRGEVTFRDFEADSDIQLIKIQDAKSVKVVNSYFSQLREVKIEDTDFCYAENELVDCDDWGSLFVSSWLSRVVENPVFIGLVTVFIVVLLIGVVAFIYFRNWKQQKELELLGYPTSTLSRTNQTPPPPPAPAQAPTTVIRSLSRAVQTDPSYFNAVY